MFYSLQADNEIYLELLKCYKWQQWKKTIDFMWLIKHFCMVNYWREKRDGLFTKDRKVILKLLF